jgi:hypothetical protein
LGEGFLTLSKLEWAAERAVHDRLVESMLARRIESMDAAIDTLVYGPYSLTEEEIKVVEGK